MAMRYDLGLQGSNLGKTLKTLKCLIIIIIIIYNIKIVQNIILKMPCGNF
jgi:hypothetical protein